MAAIAQQFSILEEDALIKTPKFPNCRLQSCSTMLTAFSLPESVFGSISEVMVYTAVEFECS